MHIRIAIVLSLALALTVAVSACGATKKPIPVIGFQPEQASTSTIAANASVISSVGISGVEMTGPGRVWKVNGYERGQVAAAHASSLGAQMLVTNYANRLGGFSEKLAHETLKSRALTARMARTLATDARNGGWNGVMLDLESLDARDGPGLVQLVADLRADLPHRDNVSTTVANDTSESAYVSEGYDLYALAHAGASVVVMAYDDHGPWEQQPGPIGPLPWQRRGIAIVRRYVPAKQVILGVAGYGYAWTRDGIGAVTDAQAVRMSRSKGARTRWVPSDGEWTSHLKNGTVVWWSDARSFAERVTLAEKLHLGGMAVWSLASCNHLRF